MDIKTLSSLSNATVDRKSLIVATHGGVFHPDDVVSCAMICSRYPNLPIQIVRTRNTTILRQCDIRVDIGGGVFDHHMPSFNKKRKTGIPYASAGLVWNEMGESLIQLIATKYFPGIEFNFTSVFEDFDASVISLVDSEDNGKKAEKHCFNFISAFLPVWSENKLEDFNAQFNQVLLITITVLEQELKQAIAKEISKETLRHTYNSPDKFQQGILEIPSQTFFWTEPVIQLNASVENPINFVIFPYPSGGWGAQCVPPSLENIFGQRVPFPAAWAGQREKLAEISGIQGAIYCSNGRFFANATTKEDIIKMCLAAMQ